MKTRVYLSEIEADDYGIPDWADYDASSAAFLNAVREAVKRQYHGDVEVEFHDWDNYVVIVDNDGDLDTESYDATVRIPGIIADVYGSFQWLHPKSDAEGKIAR